MVIAARVLHLAAATLFAVLVPRLMGPNVFGRFTLLTSVSAWFGQMSGMGVVSLVARSVPRFLASGDATAADKLFTNLFILRTGSAAGAALAFFAIVALWLGEPDAVAAAFVAAAVPARILANLCFGFLLGRNEAARWSLGELLQRWFTLVFVVAGVWAGGLRGACAGFLAASLVTLLAGLAGVRHSLRAALIDLTGRYLRPHLRLGASFAAGHILHVLAGRSGAVIIRLAHGSYVQVGYYGAALAVFQTGGQAIWQLVLALAPYLVARFHLGERRAVGGWLERLLSLLVLGTMLATFAVLFVGADLVPLVLGSAYAPVQAALVPLAFALVAFSFGAIGRAAVLIADRPAAAIAAGGVELLVGWGAGLPLARWLGAPGAAMAVLLATSAWAFMMMWPLRRDLPCSIRPALKALTLGLAFTPLLLLRGGPVVDVLLLALASGAYLGLALRLQVVTARDIAALRQLVRRRPVVTPVLAADEP